MQNYLDPMYFEVVSGMLVNSQIKSFSFLSFRAFFYVNVCTIYLNETQESSIPEFVLFFPRD